MITTIISGQEKKIGYSPSPHIIVHRAPGPRVSGCKVIATLGWLLPAPCNNHFGSL